MQGCAIPALLPLLWSSHLVLSFWDRASVSGLRCTCTCTCTWDLLAAARSQTHTIDAHSPQPTAAGLLRYSTTRPVSYTAPPITPVPVQRLRSPTRHRYQRCSRRAFPPHSPSSPSARRHDTTGAPGTATAAAASRHSAPSHPTRRPSFQTGRQCVVAESPRHCAESPQNRPQHGAALAQARQL
jgi:hypothetical protein